MHISAVICPEMPNAVGIAQLACLMMTRWIYWGVGSLAVVMAERVY